MLFFGLLLFFAGPVSAQQPRTFRVPFHTVNGMILLDATVNDKPAVLLLDTGADFTLISPQASGLSTAKLRTLTANKTTGANGEYVRARVDLRLAERHWIERDVLVMDLSDASKRLGTRIDGFIGADLLQTFSQYESNTRLALSSWRNRPDENSSESSGNAAVVRRSFGRDDSMDEQRVRRRWLLDWGSLRDG